MNRFFQEIAALTDEGGWVFWCLVALGFGIGFALFSIWQILRRTGRRLGRVAIDRRSWLPDIRGAEIGGCLEGRLRELDGRLFGGLARRIPFAFVLIGAAPLVGLLGTVSGMFTTFDGMAGAAATAPVDIVSKGVSEALITTQTGLIISVPAFIVCSVLRGHYLNLRNRFEQLECAMLRRGGSLEMEEDGA